MFIEELKEEIIKLKQELRCEKNLKETAVKTVKELEEENRKLKEKNEKLEEDNINLISFNEHYSPDVIVKYEDRYETAYNEERIENAKLCDKMRRLEEENKKLKSDLAETQKIGESWRQECKQLRKENKRLREIQIYWKTVEERIEYDRKVFRE